MITFFPNKLFQWKSFFFQFVSSWTLTFNLQTWVRCTTWRFFFYYYLIPFFPNLAEPDLLKDLSGTSTSKWKEAVKHFHGIRFRLFRLTTIFCTTRYYSSILSECYRSAFKTQVFSSLFSRAVLSNNTNVYQQCMLYCSILVLQFLHLTFLKQK